MNRKYSNSQDKRRVRIGIILYLAGVLIGAIVANLWKGFFLNHVEVFRPSFHQKLMTLTIDYGVLFGYVMWSHVKHFFILCLFTITSLGIPYIICKISYSGFTTGLLLSVAILHYQVKGILLFVLYIFPQCIFYIPVWYLLYIQSYRLNEALFQDSIGNYKKNRMKTIVERLPAFLLLLFILFIGGLVEIYVNSPIVQWALQIF